MNPLENSQQTKGINMTICIKYEGLSLLLSAMFTLYIANSLTTYELAVTINFKEPSTAWLIVTLDCSPNPQSWLINFPH